MSGKPEDAAKRDVAALAAELAGQIASLSAFAGSGLASQGFAEARPGSTAGAPAFTGPRTMLENAARFVSPVLPAGAALRPVKAALLRVLRIVTRDQTTFNSALLEALRGAQRGPGGEHGRHEARGVFQHRPRTRERGSPGRGTGARPRESL